MRYIQPLLDETPQDGAHRLAGGWCYFTEVKVHQRGAAAVRLPASALASNDLERLTAPRTALAGAPFGFDAPAVMGILNVTPDSFSDGGDSFAVSDAVARAAQMQADGAAIIDIGGESTRPGAQEVPVEEEKARIVPVIDALEGAYISVDTRKSAVVAGLPQRDFLINDVSAMRFDPAMAQDVAASGHPICLMHSVADPETMQQHAAYEDVLLDVYDHLEERIIAAEAAGIPREKIIVDPGIGFGKTLEHNLILLRGLSLFHNLGCPILLGASRKRFIGTLGNAPEAKDRLGGSVSVALHGVRQGVQILRVHDTYATKQAIDLHMAISKGQA